MDATGTPIHTSHMDGAPRTSQAITLNKAITAAGFGKSTADWSARLQKCSAAVQQGLPLQPQMALFGGGEPFIMAELVIGAIGVSGASESDDYLCAKAAVTEIDKLTRTPIQPV